MIFALIRECVDTNVVTGWCQLLYDSRDSSDKDLQLNMIAKFLRFYGYSDYMRRLGCDLEPLYLRTKRRLNSMAS